MDLNQSLADAISMERPFVVVGPGRSGTTLLCHLLSHVTGHVYQGELLKGYSGDSSLEFSGYLHDHGRTFEGGKTNIHKIVTQQFVKADLYPSLKLWFSNRNVHWLFTHRNPLDVFRSEVVQTHTGKWKLSTEEALVQEWPTQIVPDEQIAHRIAGAYHLMWYLRSMIDRFSRTDLDYDYIGSLPPVLGYIPRTTALNQYYPAWDENLASRMLLDAMQSTHVKIFP